MNTAIVTGAAQGVGLATASLLARREYRVILVDVQPMEAVLERLRAAGAQAYGVCGDISSESFAVELAGRIEEECGAADALVNNAGISFITAAFLLSERGAFINGVSLPVDGGWIADASWESLRLRTRG